MAARTTAIVVAEMIGVVDFVAELTAALSYTEYLENRERRSAIERQIEIVSEASRRIPEHLKADHTDIPWGDVAGIGNFLRHRYHAIQDEVVYKVAVHDMPALGEALRAMQARLADLTDGGDQA